MSKNARPFLTREQFDAAKAKPDALFPVMDYDICKHVWETSPLIAFMLDGVEAEIARAEAKRIYAQKPGNLVIEYPDDYPVKPR